MEDDQENYPGLGKTNGGKLNAHPGRVERELRLHDLQTRVGVTERAQEKGSKTFRRGCPRGFCAGAGDRAGAGSDAEVTGAAEYRRGGRGGRVSDGLLL
jgi:hypothetical protein